MEFDTKGILSRIDAELLDLNISKEKFYSESGVSSASYSQWNTGTHKPTKKKLKLAADYLGVTLEYLLTGEGQKELLTPQKETPTGQEASGKEKPTETGELMLEDIMDALSILPREALLDIIARATELLKEK